MTTKTENFNKCIFELLKELKKKPITGRKLVLKTEKTGHPISMLSDAVTYLKSFEYVNKAPDIKGQTKIEISSLGLKKLDELNEKQR